MDLCEQCRIYQGSSQPGCIGLGSPGGLALVERAIRLCALPPGSRIIDLGCAGGLAVEVMASKFALSACGADRSWQFIHQGLGRTPGLALFQALGERLPLPDASFDAVMVDCAFNLMGAGSMLSEAQRLLRPNGRLILADVYTRQNEYTEVGPLSKTCCLAGLLTAERIGETLREAGFKITAWEDHGEVLKQWLANLVFSLGSLEQVYRTLLREPLPLEEFQADLRQAQLSYYLLIAEKVLTPFPPMRREEWRMMVAPTFPIMNRTN